MRRQIGFIFIVISAVTFNLSIVPAQDSKPAEVSPALSKEIREQANQAIQKGIEFLKSTQQKDGSWEHSGHPDPAITAFAAKCFIQHPDYGPDHEIVKKAMAFILTFKHDDGGIYPEGAGLNNYYTSVCLGTLAAAQKPGYQKYISDAQDYLKKLQWDEEEDIDQSNPWYGGAGYGNGKRPDLSNTQMMIEALKESGLAPDDPAYKKALKFIERCQMNSTINDQSFARGSDDGGFIYSPASDGQSKAGEMVIDGKSQLRTYGTMTYAGFKSYLYANLSKDDPRVQAAFKWIQKYYTLDQNPNMPGKHSLEGLYYFYGVFAKAFYHWGEPIIQDTQGHSHNWREDLCKKLISLQNKDGSWVNTADRWYEGDPRLVTAYSILALQITLQ